MKKTKKLIAGAILGAALVTGGILYAADHVDAPEVTDQSTDITDLYVFRGASANNLVFVCNIQGLLSPSASQAARFDPNVVYEFNIDNNADLVEDLVIQCKYNADGNKMDVYGPTAPSEKGTRSKLEGNVTASVAVTPYGSAAISATGGTGIQVFAGLRDDPFYFDLTQFRKVVGGTATGFLATGDDSFKGTNVRSIVVEVPKSLLGTPNATNSINVWVESKKKI